MEKRHAILTAHVKKLQAFQNYGNVSKAQILYQVSYCISRQCIIENRKGEQETKDNESASQEKQVNGWYFLIII